MTGWLPALEPTAQACRGSLQARPKSVTLFCRYCVVQVLPPSLLATISPRNRSIAQMCWESAAATRQKAPPAEIVDSRA